LKEVLNEFGKLKINITFREPEFSVLKLDFILIINVHFRLIICEVSELKF
jgi:hypothetical protein